MDVSKMDVEGKKRVAIAYLIQNMQEVPKNLEKLFIKLKSYESGIENTASAIKQAKQSIQNLNEQFKSMMSSVNTLVELIVDDLPDDQVSQWCEKYQPKKENNEAEPVPSINIDSESVDMAGSTSKNMPPITRPK